MVLYQNLFVYFNPFIHRDQSHTITHCCIVHLHALLRVLSLLISAGIKPVGKAAGGWESRAGGWDPPPPPSPGRIEQSLTAYKNRTVYLYARARPPTLSAHPGRRRAATGTPFVWRHMSKEPARGDFPLISLSYFPQCAKCGLINYPQTPFVGGTQIMRGRTCHRPPPSR